MARRKERYVSREEDVLGAYPERMQVSALPERRFLKTSRVLAIATIFNIVILFMLGGFYIFMTDHADVEIGSPGNPYLYAIDYEKKRLIPLEYYTAQTTVEKLVSEAEIRDYIMRRHTILWDNNTMIARWGPGSWMQAVTSQRVWNDTEDSLNYQLGDSRARGFVRDVHILQLENLYGNLWEGIIETFDLPIPDSFNPLCNLCTDNSRSCLDCKARAAKGRNRFKLYVRSDFGGSRSLANPYGFRVTQYNMLFMPLNPAYPVWDLPRALQPEL